MSVALCRTCLSGNFKVYTIRNTPLQEIFQKLTNNELITDDRRPETVCYLCHSQIERWRQLRDKSLKSEEIWTQLLQNKIQIKHESITILSKRIAKAFITTPVKVITCLKVDIHHRPLPLIDDNINIHAVKIETSEVEEQSEEPQDLHNATICRSCLGVVHTTHSVINTPLQEIYEKLTNTKFVSGDGRPTAVCYICRWLLMKCYKFIVKANKCDKILTELFINGIQLTENAIAVLNKRMKTSLAVTPIKLFTFVDIMDVEVKKEIESDDDNDAEEDKSPTLGDEEISSNKHLKKSIIKIWFCDKCSYSSNSEVKLNKHKRFHDLERKFSCKKCRFRFDTNNHLRSHQKIVHALKFKCDKCPKKFPNSREFKMHKLTHTNNYFTCEVCAKVFRTRSGLTLHNNINHPNAKHPCGKCNVVFATSVHLREHELKIHTRHSVYICDICGSTFKQKCHIQKHMKFVHMEREKLECDECGKKLPNRSTMIAHLGSHRLIKPLKCKLCPCLFNTSSALSVHKKKHKSFSCKVCSSVFTLKNDLFAHFTIHPELACDVCYKFTDDMEKHKLMHKGGVPVQCHLCDKKMSRSNLSNHIRRHIGVKPHCCNVCQKRFTVRSNLNTHMLTHTGEKNISCDICDKTFIQSGQLKNHLRVHAGIKPFDCEHCGKKFSEKRSLQCHINIEHAKKIIFICDICHKVHTNKEQLIKHIKSHKGKKHQYTCPVCKKEFQNLILMCQHAKMHKNDKRPCIMCEDVLLNVQSLNRHYHIHHGVHAYACNICEEGTNDVSALLSHMRLLHNVLSYRCQTCGNVFEEGRRLLDHMRKVHGLRPKRPYIQYYSMSRS